MLLSLEKQYFLIHSPSTSSFLMALKAVGLPYKPFT